MSKNHIPRGACALAGAVKELYAAGQTDYSLDPIVLTDAQGHPVAKTRVLLGHGCCPDAITETDAEGNFRIDSLLVDQQVELWASGTTVKTNAGASSLRIVARPKP